MGQWYTATITPPKDKEVRDKGYTIEQIKHEHYETQGALGNLYVATKI